jgi:hypothetical protein
VQRAGRAHLQEARTVIQRLRVVGALEVLLVLASALHGPAIASAEARCSRGNSK